jgi:hypothetical protein
MNNPAPRQPESFEAPRGNRTAFVGIAGVVVVVLGVLLSFALLRDPSSAAPIEGELLSDASGEPEAKPASAGGNRSTPQPTPDSTVSAPEIVADAPTLPDAATRLVDQAEQLRREGNDVEALGMLKQAAVQLKTRGDQAVANADAASADVYRDALEGVQGQVDELQALIGETGAPTLENRTPHAPSTPGEVRELTIVALGNFPYDPDAGGVPADVAALEGAGIRLSGFMVPGYQTDKLREFTLVPDVYECCFGQPPGLEHMIRVTLPEAKAVNFYYGEVEVTGTLRVEEELRDGYVVNLFTIEDVTSVRATGK